MTVVALEFFVSEVFQDRINKRVLYVGAMNHGGRLCVGDRFVLRYDRRPRSLEELLQERPPDEPTNVKPVALKVAGIEWRRQMVDHLPAGHTGGLLLEGEGLDLVAAWTLLLLDETR